MKNILIIEDNADIRNDLKTILEMEGYDVSEASNGTSGFAAATSDVRPDLVICDIMMPGMDGYEVLGELRKIPEMAEIPFIFLTALGDRASHRKGMQEGADDYISKPFTSDEILKAIHSRLDRKDQYFRNLQGKIDSLKNSILYKIPRELLVPINGIIGIADILIEDIEKIETNRVQDLGLLIRNHARGLRDRIHAFLLFHSMENWSRNADLKEVIQVANTEFGRDAVREIAYRVANQYSRESDLVMNLTEMSIPVAKEHLERIIKELLDNAFRHTPAGRKVYVSLSRSEGNGMELSISDEGSGLSSVELDQLNEMIHSETPQDNPYSLSGLGLRLIFGLWNIYGGTVQLEQSESGGLKVRLYRESAA